jgi:hypothetical protein
MAAAATSLFLLPYKLLINQSPPFLFIYDPYINNETNTLIQIRIVYVYMKEFGFRGVGGLIFPSVLRLLMISATFLSFNLEFNCGFSLNLI